MNLHKLGLYLLLILAQANQCKSLTITGHPAYSPVAWAADGEIIGASTELVTKIAKDLRVEKIASVNYGGREKAQEAIKDGRADIIFRIYKNQHRATYMNYIEPPYMLDPVFVIRKGKTFIYSKWSVLRGAEESPIKTKVMATNSMLI